VEQGAELKHYLHYTTSGLDQWVEIDGYTIGAEAEHSNLKGSGAAVGKPAPDAFTLTLGDGRAATDFTSAILQGKKIDNVDVVSYVSTANGLKLVQQYALSDAYVTAVKTAAGEDGATQTTLSVVYKEIVQGVSPLGANGLPISVASVGWSIPKMTTSPSDAQIPVDTHDLSHPTPTVDSDTPLEYYVRVLTNDGRDAGGGWVALSSFGLDYAADTSFLKGTGASVGKAVPSELSLGLGIGKLMTAMLNNEIVGTAFKTVEVEAYASSGNGGNGGKPTLVDEYIFNDAFVVDVSNQSDADNSVQLVYKAFTHSHLVYDQDGKLNAAASGGVGFDVAKAILIGAPPAHADVIF
jgi:type VI secretion system secreted protein Hcp